TTAFLAPGLFATTRNFGTGFLLHTTLPTASHIGNNSLVHQILIKLFGKGRIGNSQRSSGTFCTCNIQFHRLIPLGLHSGTNDNVATGGAWYRTLDQQQVALGIDTHDFEILHSHLLSTHMTGHFLALKNPTWGLVLTN